MLYSRPQLKLLLILAATLLAGIGIREWRASFPEMADRLERFDVEDPMPPLLAPPRVERRSPRAAPPGESGPPRPAEVGDRAPAPLSDSRPLDINRANLGELARLPGVGTALAGRILAERERRGRFESPEALRYVLGMGPKKLAAIREMVTVGE